MVVDQPVVSIRKNAFSGCGALFVPISPGGFAEKTIDCYEKTFNLV
jgi:hypothetical protein